MFMQFPVKNYFIDFADPIKKIGVEVDGKKYHLDYEKDKSRQDKIENEGWKIIRILGYQTYKKHEDYFNHTWQERFDEADPEEKIPMLDLKGYQYFNTSSEGILRALKLQYYFNGMESFLE